ncbi:hypothetical protein CXT76_00160 [Candidatus Parvarchaeota archaeon]|jgi:hypothetical protein|nr:MAG: hypothetical protein CXX78_01890 [Candidatus Parvarchaeota archaeon]RZD31472.1 MAG: hypothetical protein CXT76_00160 [Candidatus Parvarchaeota archaeon]HIG52080.1 hypothetical protein [Candidatus Pacearchaeota archaeon]
MILNIFFILLAIPSGFLIAWLARDELVSGKKYFRILIIVSILGAIGGIFYDLTYLSLTFVFYLIISLISLIKSEDQKWTKRKL